MPTVTHIIDINLPVYATGNQTISGAKTFVTRPTVNGTGVLLIGEATAGGSVSGVVYTTGNQTISGTKTFISNTVLYSGVNVNYNRDTIVKFSGTTDFTNTINSSGGINFTSTPSLSTNPSILDIYQEGAWSPRFSGAISSGTYVYSTQSGTYTRIGNIVNIYGLVRLSSITTNGTGILCVNLPFSTNNNDNTQNLISSRWSLATGVTDLKPVTTGDRVSFYKITGVSTGINFNTTGTLLVASDLNASSYINFGGTYQIY